MGLFKNNLFRKLEIYSKKQGIIPDKGEVMRKNNFCFHRNNVSQCPVAPLSLDDDGRLVAEYSVQDKPEPKG